MAVMAYTADYIRHLILSVITEGRISVIYSSPEALIDGQWATKAMKKYRDRVCVLALDEVHCLSEW